jgi:hypothetical protein
VRLLLAVASAAIVICTPASGQDEPIAGPEPATVSPARVPAIESDRAILRSLRTERPIAAAGHAEVLTHDLGPVPRELVAEADQRWPGRLAVIRNVGETRGLFMPEAAVVEELPDGRTVRAVSVTSPGAVATRLHFTGFDVGDSQVYVVARDRQGEVVRGPYTGRGPDGDGDFWTPSLPGDLVRVQVTGRRPPVLEVAEVAHFDRDPAPTALRTTGQPHQPTDPLLACQVDVMCRDWRVNPVARDATVQLVLHTGGGPCSGTVLNDHDDETLIPYVLTAEHCVSSQTEADSLEVVFFYRTSTCNGSPPGWYRLPRIVGAQLLVADKDLDMSLLRLYGDLPPGTGLAGTSARREVHAYGVHHPRTSHQRYVGLILRCSEEDPCVVESPDEPIESFDYFEMVDGGVAHASSGSGAFDHHGRLQGHLKGKWMPEAQRLTCANMRDQFAVYGRWDASWTKAGYYIGLGGTIWVEGRPEGTRPIEIGSQIAPFRTVAKAHDRAWHGIRINIVSGTYPENLRLHKPVTLRAVGGPVVIGKSSGE